MTDNFDLLYDYHLQHEAPVDIYQMTTDPDKSPNKPDKLEIEFKKGNTHLITIFPCNITHFKWHKIFSVMIKGNVCINDAQTFLKIFLFIVNKPLDFMQGVW